VITEQLSTTNDMPNKPMVPTATPALNRYALPSGRRHIGQPLGGAAMQRAAERHMRAAVNGQRAPDVGGRTTSSDLRAPVDRSLRRIIQLMHTDFEHYRDTGEAR
jgi:hypothetical protein